jgi:DUF177 domain-containing protein
VDRGPEHGLGRSALRGRRRDGQRAAWVAAGDGRAILTQPFDPVGLSVKVLVDRLGAAALDLRFPISASWLAQQFGAQPTLGLEGLAEGAGVELRAQRLGADLLLEGTLTGTLELACSRCLTRYRGPIRERFRLVLEPAGERVPADPEGAAALAHDGLYLADELESGWFRGSEIQLDRFVGEVLALAVPLQPLCREDCRGLCPRCGIDRNLERCSCHEERPTSPFAVLAALRGADRK